MSALASFGELVRSFGFATSVVGVLWCLVMLGISALVSQSLDSPSVVPDMDWLSLPRIVAFVAVLMVIVVVLRVGGLSDTAAKGLATAPLVALMWYVISVIIDVSVTAAIGDTTSTQPEVHA